jgi:hypothetical protein
VCGLDFSVCMLVYQLWQSPKIDIRGMCCFGTPSPSTAEVHEREPKEGQTVDAQFWRFAIIVRPPDPGIPMIKYFGIDALRYVNFKSIFSFDGFCELKPGRRRATQFSFDSSFIHNIPN